MGDALKTMKLEVKEFWKDLLAEQLQSQSFIQIFKNMKDQLLSCKAKKDRIVTLNDKLR